MTPENESIEDFDFVIKTYKQTPETVFTVGETIVNYLPDKIFTESGRKVKATHENKDKFLIDGVWFLAVPEGNTHAQ